MRKKEMTGRNICIFMLAASLILCTGCTPREKTVLLPDILSPENAEEDSRQADDFTVRNIYTYTYETEDGFVKSAFLSGCGEHEIRVAAKELLENGDIPVCRQVDYRYGFYDSSDLPEYSWEDASADSLSAFWSLWNRPAAGSGETLTDTLEYFLYWKERLLLSPDGTRMLVCAGAESWDHRYIWLYDFEEKRPWLLYEGTQSDHELPAASFSPSGRWVAFDVRGDTTNGEVAVYDCLKEMPTDDRDKEKRIELDPLSSMYPPDLTLPPADETASSFMAAELIDFEDYVGILTILNEKVTGMKAWEHLEYTPDKASETSKGWHQQSEYWMYGFAEGSMPYIQYELDMEENRLYYLADFGQLWDLRITEGTTTGPREFPDTIAYFLRLDSGDILALATRDDRELVFENAWKNKNVLSYAYSPLPISSADLYLYRNDKTEGQLLYKNLQNVISMEYDPKTKRILLETEDWGRRTCIILEM